MNSRVGEKLEEKNAIEIIMKTEHSSSYTFIAEHEKRFIEHFLVTSEVDLRFLKGTDYVVIGEDDE